MSSKTVRCIASGMLDDISNGYRRPGNLTQTTIVISPYKNECPALNQAQSSSSTALSFATMDSAQLERRLTTLWETPKTTYGWFDTVDHKELGIRYLVTAFIFLIVGGVEALVMRLQLAHSNLAVLPPEAYDQIFTMHGVTMLFWYASPILSGCVLRAWPSAACRCFSTAR
jgi:hypothetical protein